MSNSEKDVFNEDFMFNFKRDKTKVDILFNSQCPWSSYMVNSIKKEVRTHTDIVIEFINSDDKNRIIELGLSRGIMINGCPVLKRMAPWEGLKSELDRIRKKDI